MAEKITGFRDARPCTSADQVKAYAHKIWKKDHEAAALMVERLTDEKLLSDESLDDQLTVLDWIASELLPDEKGSCQISSAELSELLRRSSGISITNNAMKDALLLAGFDPVDPHDAIWSYRISIDSPALQKALDDYREAYRREQNAG